MPIATAPWTPPPTLSPAVYFDLFPASVHFPASGSTYPNARITITSPPNQRLYVFTDTGTTPGAVVIAEYDTSLIFGSTSEGFDLVLTAPAPHPVHVQIRPSGGCGCGSRLKTFKPFITQRHTAAPPIAGSISAYSAHPGVPLP